MIGRKSKPNMLQMHPVLKGTITLVQNEQRYAALIARTSWLERLSVRFLRQPDSIRVRLDALGYAVLRQCDGHSSVQQIAHRLGLMFGAEAEPLVPRLVTFLRILEGNGWIGWKRKEPR